ncbi:unnamed protein product [Sphagnum tenellum]
MWCLHPNCQLLLSSKKRKRQSPKLASIIQRARKGCCLQYTNRKPKYNSYVVSHVEFQHPEHNTKAVRLQSSTCDAFQIALGCPVELKLSLAHPPAVVTEESKTMLALESTADLLPGPSDDSTHSNKLKSPVPQGVTKGHCLSALWLQEAWLHDQKQIKNCHHGSNPPGIPNAGSHLHLKSLSKCSGSKYNPSMRLCLFQNGQLKLLEALAQHSVQQHVMQHSKRQHSAWHSTFHSIKPTTS